uniref:Uncharacterized protein n=1 Tax=Tetradesmus obliquus TaxID=3088 RepID=A0A383WDF8_TETOB|eukprot:jgi/Sobl393_1/1876/SZX75290.1
MAYQECDGGHDMWLVAVETLASSLRIAAATAAAPAAAAAAIESASHAAGGATATSFLKDVAARYAVSEAEAEQAVLAAAECAAAAAEAAVRAATAHSGGVARLPLQSLQLPFLPAFVSGASVGALLRSLADTTTGLTRWELPELMEPNTQLSALGLLTSLRCLKLFITDEGVVDVQDEEQQQQQHEWQQQCLNALQQLPQLQQLDVRWPRAAAAAAVTWQMTSLSRLTRLGFYGQRAIVQDDQLPCSLVELACCANSMEPVLPLTKLMQLRVTLEQGSSGSLLSKAAKD